MDNFCLGLISGFLIIIICLGVMILLSTKGRSQGLPFLDFEDDTPPRRIKE